MRKFLLGAATTALIFSAFANPASANFETDPTYLNLTEEVSFYRVTRGFVSPLNELDNDFMTQIAFPKLNTTTYMDYIFINEVNVHGIHFKSTDPDSVYYQRIILMRNSVIQAQYDLRNYPDGYIPVNLGTTSIDTMKLQLNGPAGISHSFAEIELVGTPAAFEGGSPPKFDDYELITPQIIAELTVEEDGAGETDGEGTPTDGGTDITEDPTGETGTGDGTPTDGETPTTEDPTGEAGASDGTPIETDPATEGSADGEPTTGDGTATDEETASPEEPIGDRDYIDNGEEESPETGEGSEGTAGEGETGTEEPQIPEFTDRELAKAKPLTPSVFHNGHTYPLYRVNAASLILLLHQHYDEAFLLEKLANSYIALDGDVLTAEEFIDFLKTQSK